MKIADCSLSGWAQVCVHSVKINQCFVLCVCWICWSGRSSHIQCWCMWTGNHYMYCVKVLQHLLQLKYCSNEDMCQAARLPDWQQWTTWATYVTRTSLWQMLTQMTGVTKGEISCSKGYQNRREPSNWLRRGPGKYRSMPIMYLLCVHLQQEH